DFIFNNELAEECCYDGLVLDENYEPIIPLLVCIYLAQYNDGEMALLGAQARTQAGALSQEIFNKLQTDLAVTKQGQLFGAMGTRKYLYQALQRSLLPDSPRKRNIPVSVSCIRALRKCGLADDLPLLSLETPSEKELKSMSSKRQNVWDLKKARWEQESERKTGGPLLNALSDEDKRIRYAAAECLMKIAPRRKFPDKEKVIPSMIDALGESGIRVVLIVEKDLKTI
ncbi:unnamed protein product, partial [marine sediment metagenome]